MQLNGIVSGCRYVEKKCMTPQKLRRKRLRGMKKGFIDECEEVEGVQYESGAF